MGNDHFDLPFLERLSSSQRVLKIKLCVCMYVHICVHIFYVCVFSFQLSLSSELVSSELNRDVKKLGGDPVLDTPSKRKYVHVCICTYVCDDVSLVPFPDVLSALKPLPLMRYVWLVYLGRG